MTVIVQSATSNHSLVCVCVCVLWDFYRPHKESGERGGATFEPFFVGTTKQQKERDR